MRKDDHESSEKRARNKVIGGIVRAARKRSGKTLLEINAAMGWGDDNHQTAQKVEAGSRGLSADEIVKLAQLLDTATEVLVGAKQPRRKVPLFGDIGVGGEYFAHAGSGKWMEISKVDAPIGGEAVNGSLRIVGAHLEAAGYRDGDLLFFRYPGDPPDELIERRCIVQVRDGSAYVGTVLKKLGEGRLLFRPIMPGEPSREIVVEWAAWIRWHQYG